MLLRIHRKLGTPGLVLGIIACVIALGGTAIAALPGLNSKQKKEVKKIAKSLVKVGPAGSAGPQGAAGAAGAAGKDGAGGTAGLQGEPGQPGEDGACSVRVPQCELPPGATVTGDLALFQEAGAATSPLVQISYPLRTPGSGPSLNIIRKNETAMVGSLVNCPGSPAHPEAEPNSPFGSLCIYLREEENLAGITGEGFFTADPNSGIAFQFIREGAGETVAIGSWALTARCSEEEPNC